MSTFASNRSMSRALFLVVSIMCWMGFAVPLLMAQEASQTDNSDVISGSASVVDADIIRIGTQRVILWGLDAPEKRQSCYRNGEKWGCYDAAFRTLELLSGRGEVTCFLIGEPDPFGRRHGVCESGGTNINEQMVRTGMALAYSEQTDEYETVQLDAIAEGAGVWALDVEFQPPWDFRRTNTPGGYR